MGGRDAGAGTCWGGNNARLSSCGTCVLQYGDELFVTRAQSIWLMAATFRAGECESLVFNRKESTPKVKFSQYAVPFEHPAPPDQQRLHIFIYYCGDTLTFHFDGTGVKCGGNCKCIVAVRRCSRRVAGSV